MHVGGHNSWSQEKKKLDSVSGHWLLVAVMFAVSDEQVFPQHLLLCHHERGAGHGTSCAS